MRKQQKREVKKEAKRTARDSKQATWDAMTEEQREAVRHQAELDRAAREATRSVLTVRAMAVPQLATDSSQETTGAC